MRKVNKRSSILRHYNSGTIKNSYFSRIKDFILSLFSPSQTAEKFSVSHQDTRYEGYGLPNQASNLVSGRYIKLNNFRKYLTHAGIISVASFTILSNSCFGSNCSDFYAQSRLAKASANKNQQLIEINLDSNNNSDKPIVNSQKIQQVSNTVADLVGNSKTASPIDNKNSDKTDLALIQNSYLDKTNSPVTTVSDAPRKNIVMHIVKAGESLASIADKYKISIDTLRWSNGMDNSGIVKEDQELYIMPVDGIYYTVQDGENISSISEKYKSNIDDIRKWNNLKNDNVSIGQKIMLPGGKVPTPPKPVEVVNNSSSGNSYSYSPEPNYNSTPLTGNGMFNWPTAGKTISQYFGATDFNPWHTGLDIDSRSGWDIFAADSGTIIFAQYGWGGGYGNHIIIDHGNGYQTLYGHMTSFDVSEGQTVTQGQRIGTMGSTGWSTGPHLHFEIRYNGAFQNPLNYLP